MPASTLPTITATTQLVGLPPVVANDTQILILGSFPGEASLMAQQYYAHPRNQFWRLLSAVIDADLVGLPYPQRLATLLAHRIGVWDVIAACHRSGSLDTAIRDPRANDLDQLHRLCPALQRVCFNGKTSGKYAPQFAAAGFGTLILPSSSPANAQWSFDEKLKSWRAILG